MGTTNYNINRMPCAENRAVSQEFLKADKTELNYSLMILANENANLFNKMCQ